HRRGFQKGGYLNWAVLEPLASQTARTISQIFTYSYLNIAVWRSRCYAILKTSRFSRNFYKMSHLNEAISRYNKILEAPRHKDLSWVKLLHEQMEAERLSSGGRLLCPFLRPNFVTRRQYESMVKTGEALISAIERMEQLVLASPTLLAKMQLLPAEKMLAAVDPGYHMSEVAARFDLHLSNGTLQVVQYNADSPSGLAWAEGLADVFYDCPPVKEFRKRYHLTRVGGKKYFLSALLKAYKQFAGAKKPNIAILEFRTPFSSN